MFCFSFSKTQLAMQLLAEIQEKRGLPHRLTVAFHNGLHRGRKDVRTDVRRTDSDVITKPKFLAFTGYQILLAMGLRCARLRRARELRYDIKWGQKSQLVWILFLIG